MADIGGFGQYGKKRCTAWRPARIRGRIRRPIRGIPLVCPVSHRLTQTLTGAWPRGSSIIVKINCKQKTIVAVTAAALLLGTGGTLALWSDTANVATAQAETGWLRVNGGDAVAFGVSDWRMPDAPVQTNLSNGRNVGAGMVAYQGMVWHQGRADLGFGPPHYSQ